VCDIKPFILGREKRLRGGRTHETQIRKTAQRAVSSSSKLTARSLVGTPRGERGRNLRSRYDSKPTSMSNATTANSADGRLLRRRTLYFFGGPRVRVPHFPSDAVTPVEKHEVADGTTNIILIFSKRGAPTIRNGYPPRSRSNRESIFDLDSACIEKYRLKSNRSRSRGSSRYSTLGNNPGWKSEPTCCENKVEPFAFPPSSCPFLVFSIRSSKENEIFPRSEMCPPTLARPILPLSLSLSLSLYVCLSLISSMGQSLHNSPRNLRLQCRSHRKDNRWIVFGKSCGSCTVAIKFQLWKPTSYR